jgi:hypothetical protein
MVMVSPETYTIYQSRIQEEIRQLVQSSHARPVLFLGSGITKRYVSGPSWIELLQKVADISGISQDEFAFMSQKASGDLAKLGSELTEHVHKWAWSAGRDRFKPEFFEATQNSSIFIKYLVSSILGDLGRFPFLDPLRRRLTLSRDPHLMQ